MGIQFRATESSAAERKDNPSKRRLSALQIVIVVLLSAGSLAEVLVGASRLWHTLGSFGYRADWDYRVYYVDPGSPAAAAGMRRGDFIDAREMTASDRRDAAYGTVANPGKTMTLHLRTEGSERTVMLVAEAERFSAFSKVVLGA